MINVAAIRMQQFGVRFYQASLTAGDIDKLVRFEVLNYGESGQPVRGGNKKAPSKVNWDLLERRIATEKVGGGRHQSPDVHDRQLRLRQTGEQQEVLHQLIECVDSRHDFGDDRRILAVLR